MKAMGDFVAGVALTLLAYMAISHLWHRVPPTAAPIPSPALALRYGKVHASIYKITNAAQSRGGTGFKVLAPNGTPLIVTNSHVCAGAGDAGGGVAVRHELAGDVSLGYIKATDPAHDLCLISMIIDDGHPALPLAAVPSSRGAYIWTQGHGGLASQAPREGIDRGSIIIKMVSDNLACDRPHEERQQAVNFFGGTLSRCVAKFDTIDMSMDVIGGCSGSPLFNDRNEVVGVVFAGRNDGAGSNAIPVQYLINLLAK